MCGIAATTKKGLGLEQALTTLAARGPDGRAIERYATATLAQTRLAIIDLSPGGAQPKKDTEKNIAITFNGEIYNYRTLRSELQELGHRFSSESDTEVILKSYIEWGEECPKHLDGMFAFVIVDDEKRRLFLARDRFGKKPLYYHIDTSGELYAASEVKALAAMGVEPLIDSTGIDAYLALSYLPPWRTVYKNIFTLPPAHTGVFENGTLRTGCYWNLERREAAISYKEAKEETRRLIREAVKKRMLAADVEVGAFLSGGVDSTLITAYATEHLDHLIKTFSLGYGDYINELPFAEEAAKKIGTNHHTLQASASFIEELEKVQAYFCEPHGDSADLAQHLLSQETSRHVKVALAGDGGDELFMGYGWYFSWWNKPKLKRAYNVLFSNPYAAHLRSVTVFSKSERAALLRDGSSPETFDARSSTAFGTSIEGINAYDLTTYLPGQLLTKVDRMSMMHGLEVRCPLLDTALAEFAYNLPTSFKCSHTTGKILLKDLLAEIMPRAFVDRKKQGFGAPVRKWFSEETLRAYTREKLGTNASLHDHLDRKKTTSFVENTLSRTEGDAKPLYQLWALLCLELWLEKH
jgi:asparagine synthase (glutamine-hydrolysing)